MTAYSLTILTPKGGGQARKHIFRDGTISQADPKLKYFFHHSEDISTPEKLLAVIQRIASQNVAIIRGEAACERQPLWRQIAHVRERGDEGFVETPRAWLTLDIDGMKLPPMTDWRHDGIEPVIEHAVSLLPECFQDASIVWQLTTSHGLERGADKRWTGRYIGDEARLRLWVLLDRPIESRLAETWTLSMSGPLALDPAVSRTVQMNYVARPTTDAGTDPLQPFIDNGIPVVGLRKGLEDYVSVPDGIEVEARWAKAEGRTAQCASHPSAEAAIAAIGSPTIPDGRGEIRSHLWAAARHLIREERKAGRQPSAAAVADTIRALVQSQKDVIETNLMAHGRSWAEVKGYVETYQIEGICDWLIGQPVDVRAGDGGGKRKLVQRVQTVSTAIPHSINVVSVPQIREICNNAIHEFIQKDTRGYWSDVSAYHPVVTDELGNPTMPHPVPPRRMLAVSTGAGKSEAAIGGALDYLATERAAGGDKAAYLAVPHHALSDELMGRVMAQAAKRGMAVKVSIWRGRKQPDPVQPSLTMCQRPEDLDIVEAFRLPVGETLCASGKGENRIECPLAGACGYKRQAREAVDADIVIIAHALMTQGLPRSLPEAGVLFVDEAAWQTAAGGCDQTVKITATALRKRSKTAPDLDWAKRDLAKLLDGEAPEEDGGIRAEAIQALRQSMGAMGLTPGDAAKLEYDAVGKLKANVVSFSGTDLETALKRELGEAAGIKAAIQMGRLWRAIDAASELPAGSRSGRLEIVSPKGEDAVREIRIRWKEELAECWSKVPIIFLDATADATVLDACFSGITPSPRYVSHNPNVTIRQIADRAMSHAAIAPKTPEDVSQRNNAKKVKAKLISDALSRYHGQPVVAVVPKPTEAVWREDPLPSWLTLLHHGAIVGLDDYGATRAVYVVGRPLPPSNAVEAMAGAITGIEPAQKGYRETKRELVQSDGTGVIVTAWEHPDPLCEAIRRQVTEAGIIQAAGRGRGTNRTEANPLDLNLWTDTPVPELGFVEAETWTGPTQDEEMLAAGCWLSLPIDAARMHPEIVKSPEALKKARQRLTKDISLLGPSISKCPCSYRYRPAIEKRSATALATFLNDVTEDQARTYLEAKLGPLAMLERVSPAPEPEDGLQIPSPAPQEAAGQPFEVRQDPAPPPPRLGNSGPSQPDLVADELASYRGGIMPPHIRASSRALQAALGLTQEGFADLIGISRPQLANAQQGRFGLSEAAASRLVHLLRQPPAIKQPDLFAIQ